jgi:hypothetical protein
MTNFYSQVGKMERERERERERENKGTGIEQNATKISSKNEDKRGRKKRRTECDIYICCSVI